MKLFQKLLNFIKDHGLALFALVIANIAVFWQFYFKNLLPFPGDLLVSFFFPWNSGGFIGYDPWTTRKEVIAADVIRQMFPWQVLSFDLIKHGQWPLWNPYNFSGTPLLANLQSAIFFVGNIFSLVMPPLNSWLLMVIGTLSIFGLFTYIFLRSLKLSRVAATLGALAATNLSYLTIWQEQLVITRPALFLPLVLWSINRYHEGKRLIYTLLVPLFLGLAILAGHAQITIYVFVISVAFMVFKRTNLRTLLLWLIVPVFLGAVQLLPTLELYLHSAREGTATRQLFAPYILPWKNMVTAFAPDFFGNVATNNFWGQHYPDFLVYFGVVALALTVVAIIKMRSNSTVKFFGFLGLAGILFSTWPFALIIDFFHIPILATGAPSRGIFLLQFSGATLSAYGFEWWFSQKEKSWKELFWPLLPTGLVYLALWLLVVLIKKPEFAIARNNLFLPSAVFATVAFCFVLSQKLPFHLRRWLAALIFVALIFETSYQFNKYQPFAPQEFVFPDHPVLAFLQQNAGVNRFFGFGSASLDTNFATYYRIFAADGYDSLYIKRYGELLSSTTTGSVPTVVPRSVAAFGDPDNFYRNRLFDLLGIKYILDKNDTPKSNWEPEYDKFSPDRYQMVWQEYKWKAYERKSALSRAFLAGKYEVINTDGAIVSRLYAKDFDYRDSLILEKDPQFTPSDQSSGSARVVSYEPNRVEIITSSLEPKILFLSDAYYPGWYASVDGKPITIYRADYAFRAVPVEAGSHRVAFWYNPLTFKIGLAFSLISFLGLGGLMLYSLKSKRL